MTPEQEALFDRVTGVIAAGWPDAEFGISYGMPTWSIGSARVHVGVWKHGVSLYGWSEEGAAGFLERYPKLRTSKGTIQLRPDSPVTDDDLREVIAAALDR